MRKWIPLSLPFFPSACPIFFRWVTLSQSKFIQQGNDWHKRLGMFVQWLFCGATALWFTHVLQSLRSSVVLWIKHRLPSLRGMCNPFGMLCLLQRICCPTWLELSLSVLTGCHILLWMAEDLVGLFFCFYFSLLYSFKADWNRSWETPGSWWPPPTYLTSAASCYTNLVSLHVLEMLV